MEIGDYLSNIDDKLFSGDKFDDGLIGNQLSKGDESTVQVALIGVNSTKNSVDKNHVFDANKVREHLYSFSGLNLQICDYGNLIEGKTISDTYVALKTIVSHFVEKGIIPIVFGGSQELSIAISEAIYDIKKKLEATYVDAILDFTDDGDFHSQSYLNHKFFKNKNCLQTILAFQAYLSSSNKARKLKEKGTDLYRLGVIRNNFQGIEPILRDTHFCSFDMSAVRQSDSPAAICKSPNGLYAEEACQLAHLSGLSDNLMAIYLGEINTLSDVAGQSTNLLAQVLWHFLLGLSDRKGDYPVKDINEYKKIYVTNERMGSDIVFYKNEENNRYWVKLPAKSNNEIFACSESDYKTICLNEVPERIWKRISAEMGKD